MVWVVLTLEGVMLPRLAPVCWLKPAQVEVVSFHVPSIGMRPFLILREAGGRSLRAWWFDRSLPLANERQEIVHVAVATDVPRIAYQLADGTVVVSGLGGTGPLIRHVPGGPA